MVVSFKDDEKWCKEAGTGMSRISAAFGSKFKRRLKMSVLPGDQTVSSSL